ncbi:hypothetical protein IDJ75_00920 [Mucilaginibacter rigui]|uniref:Uncharacterized protein n=1 Tax=Mucilaginibacter rigui TaxID=534635 RepID=A0ABR7WZQ1_9SPHI|nr:hypothetical protein [Mucilaginibacter rigui]MBD1383824.1 hypothetical protein [Mucilaginibacter rigui]
MLQKIIIKVATKWVVVNGMMKRDGALSNMAILPCNNLQLKMHKAIY